MPLNNPQGSPALVLIDSHKLDSASCIMTIQIMDDGHISRFHLDGRLGEDNQILVEVMMAMTPMAHGNYMAHVFICQASAVFTCVLLQD